jgi:hypothetical protein
MFGYIYLDPDRFMFDFTLPILNRPILWYGFLFALGFFLGYLICRYLVLWYLIARPVITASDIPSANIVSQMIKQYKQEGVLCFKSLNDRDMSSKEALAKKLSDLLFTTSAQPLKNSLYLFFSKFLTNRERSLLCWRGYFEDLLGPLL